MSHPARLCFLLAALTLAACAHVEAPRDVALRIVAFNDFHGHLEPPSPAVGGVAHLAGAIRDLSRGQQHTAVVAAGDLVGASPLVSSLFHDEPTVELLSAAGLEASAVGNHEFDRGSAELMRLQSKARYQWLAANVIDKATGRTLLPPYIIREYGGISVAFVGTVLRSTPQIVSRKGVEGLEFRDEAASVNALVPELRAKAVEAIVLLIHQGGNTSSPAAASGCEDFEGPITRIVRRLHPAVDIVVSGHTHQAYICRLDGRLVTSAGSFGRLVTTIDVVLDRATRDVSAATATNHRVDHARFAAEPALEARVRELASLAAGRSQRVVGYVKGEFTVDPSPAGETSLGSLVADAHLAAMRQDGARIAFTNPGGLRAALVPRADGALSFGDLHTAQPFGNTLVAMTLTGAQLIRLLESQWRSAGDRTRLLQVAGISYAWDGSRPRGRRVDRESVRVGNEPLVQSASYRVVVNSFLADGGDGFTIFTEGIDRTGGPLDVEALERHIASTHPLAAPAAGRIRRIDR
ncbi:MAG: 5'-nucleotidase C-terminal domain-containing protein [Burkholderiales bacterium]|nr:5'-nucleotidase C-terminal domain-containing protein [Burkholderiales bacterium]